MILAWQLLTGGWIMMDRWSFAFQMARLGKWGTWGTLLWPLSLSLLLLFLLRLSLLILIVIIILSLLGLPHCPSYFCKPPEMMNPQGSCLTMSHQHPGKNISPLCIASGMRMLKEDWSNCPACNFPARHSVFTATLQQNDQCPMCDSVVKPQEVTLVPDPVNQINYYKSLFQAAESESAPAPPPPPPPP